MQSVFKTRGDDTREPVGGGRLVAGRSAAGRRRLLRADSRSHALWSWPGFVRCRFAVGWSGGIGNQLFKARDRSLSHRHRHPCCRLPIGGYSPGACEHAGSVSIRMRFNFRDTRARLPSTGHCPPCWAPSCSLSPVGSMIGGPAVPPPVQGRGGLQNSAVTSGPMDGYVDGLLRPDAPSSQQGDHEQSRSGEPSGRP